jgi:hypothetical protein
MSSSQDPTLDACNCCEGVTQSTPQSLENLPGLSSLVYRVGTHGFFKASMIARLGAQTAAQKLTTRDDTDPGIALLDAAATMLDVLTFYQDRIANEGYLRTANERRSVLELAREIGYELNPGVAASTYLAFTLDSAIGSPGFADIPKGTRVQSIPEQNQKPQTFESVAPVDSRAEWNALLPKLTELVLPSMDDTQYYVKGTATNLRPGDGLLLVGDERLADPTNENWDFRRVKAVTPVSNTDPEKAYTLITVDRGLGSHVPFVLPARKNPRLYALRQRANIFGYNAPDWKGLSNQVRLDYLGLPVGSSLADYPDWPDLTIAAVSDPPTDVATGSGLFGQYYNDNPDNGIHFKRRVLLRTDAQLDFSFSAAPAPGVPLNNFSVRWTGWVQPKVTGLHTLTANTDDGVRVWIDRQRIIDSWVDQAPTEHSGTIPLEVGKKVEIRVEYYNHTGPGTLQLFWAASGLAKQIIPASQLYPGDIFTLHLDAAYPQVLVGSWAVLSMPDYQEAYEILTAVEDSRARFTLSGKSTRLTLRGENLRDLFNDRLRETAVFCQSEELVLAEQPITRPLRGDSLTLDRHVSPLQVGRTLIVSGKRSRVGVAVSGLNLIVPGASAPTPLAVGDTLLLLQAPVPQQGGLETWTLQTLSGESGSLDAPESSFNFLPARDSDLQVSEVVSLKISGPDPNETVPAVLKLVSPLLYCYDLPTVTIYANVAPATHGETKNDVLGSGDASQAFQTFTLKNSPLTYVSAPTPNGAETTLEVRVNDILWKEADSLYGLDPRQRAYVTHIDDDGKVTIEFGDGANGARLPSGDENVTAVYRTGTGAAGMLKPGQLSLLMNRILGVQKVTNPLAPIGAADPESREQARQNAPFTVLTLGRIVSQQDFQDFARAFAGIGKAQASWLWDGQDHILHLTVASSTPVSSAVPSAATTPVDFRVDPKSDLYKNLTKGINLARDGVQRVQIDTYNPLLFRLRLRILVDPAYLPEKVSAAVDSALGSAYAFTQRNFGQSVTRSELLALVQGIEGVQAAFLDKLFLSGQPETLQDPLIALPARRENNQLKLADLLLIDPAGIFVETILQE